ncbi:hypothetical protein BCF53_10945 [Reinekea marinisedimentorum]|uniref:Uncharacterized protein n=1 Tax=Reinekea marinisedimentorum TaxID=230495 RepID=A0A4R3I3P6_9GAMM|nr:hypothetical protein BCF53_10945 [Reinekea marinisedimentorum]
MRCPQGLGWQPRNGRGKRELPDKLQVAFTLSSKVFGGNDRS